MKKNDNNKTKSKSKKITIMRDQILGSPNMSIFDRIYECSECEECNSMKV